MNEWYNNKINMGNQILTSATISWEKIIPSISFQTTTATPSTQKKIKVMLEHFVGNYGVILHHPKYPPFFLNLDFL